MFLLRPADKFFSGKKGTETLMNSRRNQSKKKLHCECLSQLMYTTINRVGQPSDPTTFD